MYMRFLQLKLSPEFINDFKKFYETDVIPELHKTPGCLFAGLIKSKPEENEFSSLTFWKSQEEAENYETRGTFKKLFEQIKKFLSLSVEWKIQLSENMELQYNPVQVEPIIKNYVVTAPNENNISLYSSSNMCVRILSLKIQSDKIDEFKKLYSEVVIPTLRQTQGCRYVFLIESIHEKNEFISVTIWENKEDANKYESSRKYREITDKIKHTFSQFYLWKMSLENEHLRKVITSEDFKIEKYDLVTGKSFSTHEESSD